MDGKQLMDFFNEVVRSPSLQRSFGECSSELREEFERRGYDYSSIADKNGFSFEKKAKLTGNKIVVDEEFYRIISLLKKGNGPKPKPEEERRIDE